MNIVFDRADWERIAADGGGLLVVEGVCPIGCSMDGTGRDGHNRFCSAAGTKPPSEWVEAAKLCETCGGVADGLLRRGDRIVQADDDCPDCRNGKRIVTAQVKCPTCTVEQDGRIRVGMELCTKCRPRHWEFCSTCTTWSDDEFTITSTAGLVTVGQVTVIWGPLPIVDSNARHDLAANHVCVDVRAGTAFAYICKPGRGPYGGDTVIADEVVTLPPGVDPASLVGKYVVEMKLVKLIKE